MPFLLAVNRTIFSSWNVIDAPPLPPSSIIQRIKRNTEPYLSWRPFQGRYQRRWYTGHCQMKQPPWPGLGCLSPLRTALPGDPTTTGSPQRGRLQPAQTWKHKQHTLNNSNTYCSCSLSRPVPQPSLTLLFQSYCMLFCRLTTPSHIILAHCKAE